jgi:2-dehydropantoate 2-reductase
MKILIFGAGVLGCYYTKIMSQLKVDAALLARGEKAERFKEHGITFHNYITDEEVTIQPKILEPPVNESFDLVLVFVQAIHVPAILPLLKDILGVKAFCFMGNNTRGFAEAAHALGKERVLSGFGGVGGTWRDRKLIYVDRKTNKDQPFNYLILGAPFTEGLTVLEDVHSFFTGLGLKVLHYEPINDWHLSHAAMIAGLAGMLYKNNCDLRKTAQDRAGIKQGLMATRDALKGFQNAGHKILPQGLKSMLFFPSWLISKRIQKVMMSRFAEIGLAGHAQAARKEMKSLTIDIYNLVKDQGKCDNLKAWLKWF